jgi:four helix bundle protein
VARPLHWRGDHERPYDIKERTFLFATEVLDLCKPMMPPGGVVRELARQLLRSSTSIGANVEGAQGAHSSADFRAKLSISRKEARESAYWLRLLVHADSRLKSSVDPLVDETQQLIQIVTTIKLNSEQRDKGKDDEAAARAE